MNTQLFCTVLFGVGLCRLFRMMASMHPMPASSVGMVRSLLVVPRHGDEQHEYDVRRPSYDVHLFALGSSGELTDMVPGRRGRCPPRPPQIRTRRFPASGSSRERFVPAGVAVDDPGRWQRMTGEERVEVSP